MAHLAPREIARDFIYLSSARLVSLAVNFVRSLFIPRLLGPEPYGAWKTLGIFQSYMQFSDFGAGAALKREIPLYASRGDEDGLRRSRDVAFFVNNAVVLVAGAAALVGSLIVESPAYGRAIRLFILLVYARQINGFLEKLLFWRKDFSYASRLALVLSLLESALAIGGTMLYGLDGLIVGTFVAYSAVVYLQLRRIDFGIGFTFSWKAWAELVKIGFPSHVNGLLYNILTSIDRMLILPVLGLAGVGLYGLAMTINDYLFQLSYAFGHVLSPRLVERWGERESLEDVRPMVETPTLAIAVVAPVLLGAVYFSAAPAIEIVLPDFREAILPLRILLVGTYFSSLHRGMSSFFLAIRKQGRLLPAYAFAIVLNAAMVWLALDNGFGITGVALASTTAMTLFSLALIVMAQHILGEGIRGQARFVMLLAVPLAWASAAMLASTAVATLLLGGRGGPAALGAAGLALYGLLYAPAIYFGYRFIRSRGESGTPQGAGS